jgi:hypothetical protein
MSSILPKQLFELSDLLNKTRQLLTWELLLVANPDITARIQLEVNTTRTVTPMIFMPARELEEFIGNKIQENLMKLSDAGVDMSVELETFKSAAENHIQQNNQPVDKRSES